MKLEVLPYKNYEEKLPQEGYHILSQHQNNSIFVYQAFNPKIATYAIEHQKFGGKHYKFERMSWIKPNFLWMMYRSGWASKENQERILAIEINKSNFEKILKQAIHSSFVESIYETKEKWKEALSNSNVRLQWDPDHDPKGEKLNRRAIQLGLRGATLKEFNEQWINSIEDITDFVSAQRLKLEENNMDELLVVKEEVLKIESEEIRLHLGIK